MFQRVCRQSVTAIALAICVGSGNQAAAQEQSYRVTAVKEDRQGRLIVLETSHLGPFPAPKIQYLPGPDRQTVLAADFTGIVLPSQTLLIRGIAPGITHVRIGQFQQHPPVCRIAVSAANAGPLRRVAFETEQGRLIVRLEEEVEPKSALYAQTRQDTATNPTGRQPALEYERGCVQGSSPDAINSSRDIQAAPTSLYRRELPLQGAAPQSPQRTTAQPEATYPPQAPPVARKIEQELSFTPMRDTVPDRWWPNITVSRQDAETLQVVVAAPGPITHHSFRLKEPDRYVIDFPGVRELSQVSHPALAEGDLVKQIRLGNPDADPSILRMVLDLSGTDVLVTERKSPDGHMLALAITKVNSSLASIRVPPGMTVVIDPGHGGSDPGAERAAVQEKELTLAIAKKMSALLRQGGVRTILTRDQDSSVSLEERINQTNSANPHAFVSIHINSLESKSDIHGIETYFQTQQSRGLAEKVHNALVKELNAPDRDIRRAKFYVINHTPVPAVLAEVGFLSHPEEREKLISSEYQMKVATGLARGVMLYLTQNSLAVAPARKIIGQAPLPGIE